MRTLLPIHSHEDEELTEYELARLAAIKANAELLLSLGLDPAPATPLRPRKKARVEEHSTSQREQEWNRGLKESSQAEDEEEVARQLLGRGVRPGHRRISREEPGWGIFAGVVIGDDADDGEYEGSVSLSNTPSSSSSTSSTSSRGKGAARPLAASESPRPSARSASPVRKLRGRAESAPFALSRPLAQGQSQGQVRTELAPRRSARNEEKRAGLLTPAATSSLAAGSASSSGSLSSETRRFSQKAFVAPDSGRAPPTAALVDSEGDFTFHTRVLPRLIRDPAPARRQRRGTSSASSTEASNSPLLLQLGRTLPARIYSPKRFGPIPGIAPGTWYPSRIACSTSSLHAPTVAGISGDSSQGAYSLCLSGGYEDDVDSGDTVTFTGSGGRDLRGTPAKRKNLRTAPQSTHQSFANPLNAALRRSKQTQKPVRVLRGFRGRRPYAPPEGYLYCGLYVVERCWTQRGQSGFDVCRFALKRLEGQGELPTFKSEGEE